ncbi:MAG TPA: class I SAM-dependent methyltransferase [Verrucomicrobiae bacterium]|nr:class I SAM-dependent methyltransferase [Verrucomicrobiae bacterium]
MSSERIRGEEAFHDAWAAGERVEGISLKAMFEGCTAVEHHYILGRLGEMRGRKLLDVGAGLGETSVYFARRGAEVTASDVSGGMLQFAGALAAHHGVTIGLVQAAADALPFPDGSFDIVYIANALHHVSDIPAAVRELHRVLRPGGTFVSIDPIAYNPAINVYRRMAMGVRTEDEHPLRRADVAAIREPFSRSEVRMFWLLGLLLFAKFFFVDRVDPNADRYWKRIFRVERQIRWWFRPLAALDRVLLSVLPPLGWWCWNVVVVARK